MTTPPILTITIDWTHFRLVTAGMAALCCFTVALLAFIKNRPLSINVRYFIFFNLAVGLWNISDIVVTSSPARWALFFDRLSYVWGTFTVPTFAIVALECAGAPPRGRLARALLIGPMVFLLAVSFTPWLIQDVKVDPRFVEVPGPVFPLFFAYFVGWVGYGVVRVFMAFPTASGVKRNQLKYLVVAFAFAFIAGTLYLTTMIYPDAPAVYYVPEMIYTAIMTYTIVRYKLMDINLAFRYGTILFLMALIVGIPFVLLLLFLPKNPLLQLVVMFLAPLLGYLAINKLKQGVTTVVDSLPPFKGRYDQYKEDFIQAQRKSILNAKSLHLWAEKVLRSVKDMFGVDAAAVLVHDAAYDHFVSLRCMGLPRLEDSPVALESGNPVLRLLNGDGNDFLLKDDLSMEMADEQLKEINDELKLFAAHVCVALRAQGKLAGLVMIGAKRKGEMFNHLDVRSLGRIKSGAEDALGAILSSLSQGEFSSSFAHDLMHPFGPKGSFQRLFQMLDGKLGPLSPEQQKTVSLALKEAGYVWKNLGNVLNPQKYMRESESTLEDQPLTPLFERTRVKYDAPAKQQGVHWIVSPPAEDVLVHCDADDLEYRVIINLVDNAFRYVKEGGAVELGHRLENGSVIVFVKDTGPGVPPDRLDKLFVGRVVERGPNGGKAGWGLYNAKTVVEAHGGKIWVDNEPGRGASFCFRLPVMPHDRSQGGR